jgi:SAM-dependent methyltransferase
MKKVSIETANKGPYILNDGLSYDWRDSRKATGESILKETGNKEMPIELEFLEEKHHKYYGRPWCLGKYQIDFLRLRGLKVSDQVLDFGCGSGRLGIWAISFLSENKYFGIDSHRKSLEAFSNYEIPLHGLESKNPRLLHSLTFEIEYFATLFDWIIDFYSSIHIDEKKLPYFLKAINKNLKPFGKYITVPQPKLLNSSINYGLKLTHTEKQDCPMLRGHKFESFNIWHEFQKIESL